MSLEGKIKQYEAMINERDLDDDWESRQQMSDGIIKMAKQITLLIREKITHWQLRRVYDEIVQYGECYMGKAEISEKEPEDLIFQYDRLIELNDQLECDEVHYVHSEEFGIDDDGGPSYHAWFMTDDLYQQFMEEYIKFDYDEAYMPREYLLLPKYIKQYHSDERLIFLWIGPY